MKIYICLVTNNKSGIREIGLVTQKQEEAKEFHLLEKKDSLISHTEEWDVDSKGSGWMKEYITEEDWEIKKNES